MEMTSYAKKTRWSLIMSSLIHEPFSSIYIWLPFILRKDLNASVLQIAILVTLKPVISIFSFYYTSLRSHNVRQAFVTAGILARIPFLLFPFFNNIWYFIFASTTYMLFYRAAIPSWMEILKLNLNKEMRHRYFTLSSAMGYAEGVFLSLYLGYLLDVHFELWRSLFALFAAIGIVGVVMQAFLPINRENWVPKERQPLKLLQPWKDTIKLMRERPDFAHFQWGFMGAGFGIMLVIVVVPLYFADILQLSHKEFANARYIFMGFGFILCSPIWSRLMNRLSVFQVTSLVTLSFAFFPISLMFATTSPLFLYLAFAIYGLAQSGSHTVWHLSGPIFAQDEDSSHFSGVNIVMVGLRGMVAPLLGGLLYATCGSMFVLVLGMLLCLFSSWFMLFRRLPQSA